MGAHADDFGDNDDVGHMMIMMRMSESFAVVCT